MRLLTLSLAAVLLAGAARAEAPAWNVDAPPVKTREVAIDVDEGTWMNLDVSPDGRTIVFDLLGDIYALPIGGGEARVLAEGMAFEMQPRFSPDGSMIAFTSDRGGGDNIWVMKADGTGKRQVTRETFRMLNNPTWSPDGRFIAARKHFTTRRSLGTGEIWLYHLDGGDGVRLVERPGPQHQKELGEPAFSADGRWVYFSQDVTPGGVFIYAQDSNTNLFDIRRYDTASGEVTTAVSGYGGSVRPTPSPDGKSIAFVRRERMSSTLWVKDLASGVERKVWGELDRDMQEGWAIHGLYPNLAWLPGGRELVFWAGGKIRRLDVTTGTASVIPFHVEATRAVAEPPRPPVEVAPDRFRTRMARFAAVSPADGSVVFESLGRLYLKPRDGAARPLTKAGDFALFPSWSRDGRRIAYVSWNDDTLGTVRVLDATGRNDRAVTTQPGHYRHPRFSPDGRTLVFEKGRGGGDDDLTNPAWSEAPGLYRVAVTGGEPARISATGIRPHFGAAGDRVFLTERDGSGASLVSVDLDGGARRVHATGELATEFQVSPAGDRLAFREAYNVFVMPLAPGAQKLEVGARASAVPVARTSREAGAFMSWSGRSLSWTMGPVLFAEGGPSEGLDLSVGVEAAKPSGVVALTGARILTMAGADGGVIERGTIVIEGNRIKAIGAAAKIPAGAEVVDLAGKVVMPGLIDVHAHGPQAIDDIVPQRNWFGMANLAMGQTTIFDPHHRSSHFFAASEYQKAGLILTPRLFSTGEKVYGAKDPDYWAPIDSYEDALAHVRRLKSQGAIAVKDYNRPRRSESQQLIAAARAEGLAVVAEGGSLFAQDIGLIQDGVTSIEHNLPQSRLYEDVLSLFAGSGVDYTPTLGVTFGGVMGETYWRQATDVWTHPILSLHAPPRPLQARSVRRPRLPEEDAYDQVSAANARRLAERGVRVSIGGHGQEAGVAAHWELWSFVRGGMSPLQALQAGTIQPARHLGLDRDIGSLEPGKLADLVVLDADPMADIRNSDRISQVMLNGRLYDARTLDEVATGAYRRGKYWWEP